MRFFVSRPENLMCIDNVAVNMDCSSLDPGINYVVWNENGSGFLEPSSGIALRTPFSDPSPYQALINLWMATQAAATPALTLAQAQAVKSELVDAIWLVKAKANVTVSTSQGSFTFDAGNDMQAALNMAAWMPAVAQLIAQTVALNAATGNMMTSVNTTFSNLVAEINAMITAGGSGIDAALANLAAQVDTYTAGIASQLNINWDFLNNSAGIPVPDQIQNGSSLTTPTVSTISGVSGSYTGPTALPTLTAPVKMLPVGATVYPSFTLADLFAVVTAIQNQRANETLTRSTKQVAIAALATVANVITFDATSGW